MKDKDFGKIVELKYVHAPFIGRIATLNPTTCSLNPAGGMEYDSTGQMECEGGPVECQGHRYFACIINLAKHDVVHYLTTISCFEDPSSGTEGNWAEKIESCAKDQREELEKCVASESKALLEERMKEEREANIEWVPFVSGVGW